MTLPRWFAAMFALSCLGFPLVAAAQLEEIEEVLEAAQAVIRPGVPMISVPAAEAEAKKDEKVEPEIEPNRKPKAALPPRHMVLRLVDGSTIAGDLSVNEIKVTTDF